MNRNSNVYTVVYATIMVIVVAAILAFAAISLKEPISKNKEVEKKLNILMAVNKAQNVKAEANKRTYVEQEYEKYIKESFLVDVQGNRIEGDKNLAFNLDLKLALSPSNKNRQVPVFVCESEGKKQYIFPVHGAGLWGPLWGFIALEDDFNTVCGATFDHKGETPGLGAEISTPEFQKQFVGKTIFEADSLIAIRVIKKGAPTNQHSVDGISGGTITSKAVDETILKCLSNYKKYFELNRKKQVVPADLPAVLVDSLGQALPALDSTKLKIQ